MTVRQMASLVHSPTAVRRVMAVLRAYFDESGVGSSRVFAMGGYLATEADWTNFEKRWCELLRSPLKHANPTLSPERAARVGRPLEYLHAQEMEGLGIGRFRAIGQRNRDYLKHASVGITLESPVIGIGSAVLIPEYKRLDARVKKEIGDPYLLCFQHVIIEVFKYAKTFIGENHSEGIAYVFEQQPKWQTKASALWIKSVEQGFKKRFRMGSLTFGDKKDFMPLQAADRNAFEVYQHFSNSTPRDTWQRMFDSPNHHGQYFDREGFESLIGQLKKSGRIAP